MSKWDRERVWQIVGIAAIAVLGAVVAYGLFVPERTPVAVAPQAAGPSSSAPVDPQLPVVSVIGDSYTAGSPEDSGPASLWPHLLETNLQIDLSVSAVGGNGYNLADGDNFAKLASGINPSSAVVVVLGSVNDQDGYDITAEGARAALTAASEIAPTAKLVIIGPPVPEVARGAEIPPALLESRDALRDVTAEMGVTFVDPIELAWFAGRPELLGSDLIHPNDAGHQYLYEQIRSIVEPLLPAL